MTLRGGLVLVALLPVWAPGRAAGDGPLEFHRVHVPTGRIDDVPLGGERHVPMPIAEFEAAVARAATRAAVAGQAALAPRPLAATATTTARLDERGWLVGTVRCEVAAAAGLMTRSLPLGDLPVRSATRVDSAGQREAVVFGTGTGGLALDASEAGTYQLEFAVAPRAAGTGYRLSLVPALENVIDLELPADARPVLSGAAARDAVVSPPVTGSSVWRVACGPADVIDIAVVPRERPAVGMAVWARVRLGGSAAEVAAACVPTGPWRPGSETLETTAALRIAEIMVAEEPLAWQASDDGRRVTITVPTWLEGRRSPIVVRGFAPATGAVWRLPLVAPLAGGWAGGGWIVETEPTWAVAGIEVEESHVVTPEAAAAWPVPGTANASRAGRREAVVHIEQQGPAATVAVTVAPHAPLVDVARVTTVDISPGAVLGRTACDVRVLHGAAFEITARVAPGWIVDAVTLVEPVAVEPSGVAGARLGAAIETAPDWRIARGPAGDVLRVGLPEAATPSRGVGLRVAGHWRGLPPGTAFGSGDIDMVRFVGETAETAFIDFKLGSDAFIEIGAAPVGWLPLEGRLAALAEEGASRGRIRAGEWMPERVARLVRRRPPLEARVRVDVEPRDGSLVQAYEFECRAEAGGIDSFVADFSTPLGDGLEWALVDPGGATIAARRIEPGEAARRPAGVAESWLVELSPAVDGPVRVRATRAAAFTGTAGIPLAWVEGATAPGGTVALRDAADLRIRARSSGLRAVAVDVRHGATVDQVAEFAYGAAAPGLVLEVEPNAGGDARAWAWRETVSCRCEESGTVESESRFTLENRGRDALVLSVPAGCRLLAVLVNGVAVVDDEAAASGGTVRVPLPASGRRIDVVARMLAAHGGSWGVRRIDPPTCGIDAPVLEREVRLLLPPRLEVAATAAAWRAIDEPERSWLTRLLGRGPVAVAADETAQGGFRVRRFVIDTDREAGGIVVVHTGLLAGGSVLAAAAVLAWAWLCRHRNPAASAVLASLCGMLALWLAPPFDGVARVAWWAAVGGLAATLAARWWPQRWPGGSRLAAARLVSLGVVGAAAVAAGPAVAGEGGWRVFVTPDERGATALVPEPLFRLLAEASAPTAAAIRVTNCRVAVQHDVSAPWQVELVVDADAGGTLVLDQGEDEATWMVPPSPPAAVFVRAEPAGGVAARRLRLTAAGAGRHRVVVEVRPAGSRHGDVDFAAIRLPAAPRADVLVAGPLDPGAIGCDRAVGDGPFLPVFPRDGGGGRVAFDVAGASRVRLVRPVDPRVRLAERPRRAATLNAVEWNLGAARVETTFELDPGPAVLTAVTVAADDRLAGLAAVGPDAARPRLTPLGGGAIRVAFAEPVRGPVQLRLAGTVAYPSPVGVFELPTIWLAGVPDEMRSVRVAAAPELDVTLDPAPPAVATAAEFAARPALRVVASRRRQRPRGVQALAAAFGPDRIGLELRAQIDTGPLAFAQMPVALPPGCTVDRVVLIDDDLAAAPGRPRSAVDIVWERATAEQLVVVVQEPRAGRFRLEIDARVAVRAGDRGTLPLMRAGLAGGAPLVVTWRNDPDAPVDVQSAVGDVAAATVELRDGDPVPTYEMLPATAVASPPPAVTAEPTAPGTSRIERAEAFLALDARGRVRGAVRFDLTSSAADVRLRLPVGMRLFDVVVDGLDTVAEPSAAETWSVRLHDVRWPRSILALFAGELGADAVGGEPVVIAAPAIEGLPAPEMAWTLRPPAGCMVVVAPPGRRPTAADLEAFRRSGAAAVERGFAPALASASGPELQRLAALAAARRGGGAAPPESDWERGLGWAVEPGDPAAAEAVALATGSLTLRIARRPNPTSPGRAAATVVLAAAGGLAWIVAARRRSPAVR